MQNLVRNLEVELKDQVIEDIEFRRRGLARGNYDEFRQAIKGHRIIQTRQFGQHIVIDLSGGQSIIAKMNELGELLHIPTDKAVIENTDVIFKIKDDTQELTFKHLEDIGFIKLVQTDQVDSEFPLPRYDKEPIRISFLDFKNLLYKHTARMIKPVLMDTAVIVGISSIYADEILFRAKIHPKTKVKDIPEVRLDKLHHAMYHILQIAMDKGIDSFDRYCELPADDSERHKLLQVTQRTGEICRRCKVDKISSIKVSNETSYFCPKCQPVR